MKQILLTLVIFSFIYSSSAQAHADTPCGQHDCHCVSPVEQQIRTLKKNGADERLAHALAHMQDAHDKSHAKKQLTKAQHNLYLDGALLSSGLLCALIQRSLSKKYGAKTTDHQFYLLQGLFASAVVSSIVGVYFGARDGIDFMHAYRSHH